MSSQNISSQCHFFETQQLLTSIISQSRFSLNHLLSGTTCTPVISLTVPERPTRWQGAMRQHVTRVRICYSGPVEPLTAPRAPEAKAPVTVVVLLVTLFTFRSHLSFSPLPTMCHVSGGKHWALRTHHFGCWLVTKSCWRKRFTWLRMTTHCQGNLEETNSSHWGNIFWNDFSNYFEITLNLRLLASC